MSGLLRIEVANWKVVAVFAGASLVFGLLVLRRRNRWLPLGLSLCLAATAAADAVNTYFGYLPQVADVVGVTDWPTVPAAALTPHAKGRSLISEAVHDSGGVVSIRIAGVNSGLGMHHAYVYLPPQYFASPRRRFPVIYLLHGSPGRPQDWLRAAGAVRAGAEVAADGHPVLLVMPTMSHGWLDDSECVDGSDGAWETWLTSDVVSAIDRQFRTRPTRLGRALAGMSAGGYCSLNLLVRHSDEFAVALDMSGYTIPTHAGGDAALFGQRWRTELAANTPSIFITHHPLRRPVRLRFDVGRGDHEPQREFDKLEPRLTKCGMQVLVVHRAGGHTYHVWAPALRSGIEWIAEALDGETGVGTPNLHLLARSSTRGTGTLG